MLTIPVPAVTADGRQLDLDARVHALLPPAGDDDDLIVGLEVLRQEGVDGQHVEVAGQPGGDGAAQVALADDIEQQSTRAQDTLDVTQELEFRFSTRVRRVQ